MSAPASVVQSTVSSRTEHVFPTLTPEQVARIASERPGAPAPLKLRRAVCPLA